MFLAPKVTFLSKTILGLQIVRDVDGSCSFLPFVLNARHDDHIII